MPLTGSDQITLTSKHAMDDTAKFIIDRLRTLQGLIILVALAMISMMLVEVRSDSAALVMGEVSLLRAQCERIYRESRAYPPTNEWVARLGLTKVKKEAWWPEAIIHTRDAILGSMDKGAWQTTSEPLRVDIDRTWSGMHLMRWPTANEALVPPAELTVRQMVDWFAGGSVMPTANNAGFSSQSELTRALLEDSLDSLINDDLIEGGLVTESEHRSAFNVTIGGKTRLMHTLALHEDYQAPVLARSAAEEVWGEPTADLEKIEIWLEMYDEDGETGAFRIG